MALIIRQLRKVGSREPVTFEDFPEESLDFDSKIGDVRIYRYMPRTDPLPYSKVYSKELFNGDMSDSPVEIFTRKGSQLVVSKRDLGKRLYDEWGEGQYSVFKFGGNPPKEGYFENRVVTSKGGSS